ncbi:DUF7524 family protein [Candidatus Methanoliparum sp. LAM-1]|uniref:DUF7524 family protein n=1 Tax=Candidatus Methanoliparum sp. LAM-1 TaxID=2874846 RepID=UPI001E43D32C|nr:hypothetical protein [Candidatus Methanoliparum sp. LAM-1]BDC35652.1 hypothetical protein MTLP_03340 [Candidatus Methanoliparum sp. LAM-1]
MPEEIDTIIINRIDKGYIELNKKVSVNVEVGKEDIIYIPIKNYGPPTHVYLSVDPKMKNIAYLFEANYYVEDEVKIPLIIQLPLEKNIYDIDLIITASYGLINEKFSIKAVSKNLKRKEEISQKETQYNVPTASIIRQIMKNNIISNRIKAFFGKLYKNK